MPSCTDRSVFVVVALQGGSERVGLYSGLRLAAVDTCTCSVRLVSVRLELGLDRKREPRTASVPKKRGVRSIITLKH